MTRSPQEYLAVATADSHRQDTKELYGNKLAALDGDIGHVRDFHFDDKTVSRSPRRRDGCFGRNEQKQGS